MSLDIEGFRSMKKVHWAPNQLNVVIGANGAGKSNLLRFLELVTISAQAALGKYRHWKNLFLKKKACFLWPPVLSRRIV